MVSTDSVRADGIDDYIFIFSKPLKKSVALSIHTSIYSECREPLLRLNEWDAGNNWLA